MSLHYINPEFIIFYLSIAENVSILFDYAFSFVFWCTGLSDTRIKVNTSAQINTFLRRTKH